MRRAEDCWKGDNAQKPCSHAARRILRDQLKQVRDCLYLAVRQSDYDIELFRRLRATTHVTLAAMMVCREVICKRRATEIKQKLRELRRVTDKAHDLDVIEVRLNELDSESKLTKLTDSSPQLLGATGHPIIATANACLTQERKLTQKRLRKQLPSWKQKRIDRQIDRLVRRIKWRFKDPEPKFDAMVRSKLSERVDRFFSLVEHDLSQIDILHKLGSRGEQIRYLAEFASVGIESSLCEEFVADLYWLQDKLDAVIDHATAKRFFTKWTEQTPCKQVCIQLSELAAIEDDKMQKSFQQFRDVWTSERLQDLRRRLNHPFDC